MTATARLLDQRSIGHVSLHVARTGPVCLREAGAAKVRLPYGGRDAILINTGGGLAGGDAFGFDIACGAGAALTVTSQAAERVYRTLGPAAKITVSLKADAGAELLWLPQETILYDGSSLSRSFAVALAPGARFLAVEAVVFGRMESGETIQSVRLQDRWRITRDGALVHGDDVRIDGSLPTGKAALNGARAMASIIHVAEDAEGSLERVRAALGKNGGASAWNGKLVARVLAQDGFHLRKALIPALNALAGSSGLPKIWTL